MPRFPENEIVSHTATPHAESIPVTRVRLATPASPPPLSFRIVPGTLSAWGKVNHFAESSACRNPLPRLLWKPTFFREKSSDILL